MKHAISLKINAVPEETKELPAVEVESKCLQCRGMSDFVGNLQNEIKRLTTVTRDLESQLMKAGAKPEVPDHLKPTRKVNGVEFRNICPPCQTFKATQRPNSGGRLRQMPAEFRIRKHYLQPTIKATAHF